MAAALRYKELIQKFSESVGIEKSEMLIKDTLSQLGVEKKDEYERDEAIRVLEKIRDGNSGFIKIVANMLLTDIYTS